MRLRRLITYSLIYRAGSIGGSRSRPPKRLPRRICVKNDLPAVPSPRPARPRNSKRLSARNCRNTRASSKKAVPGSIDLPRMRCHIGEDHSATTPGAQPCSKFCAPFGRVYNDSLHPRPIFCCYHPLPLTESGVTAYNSCAK